MSTTERSSTTTNLEQPMRSDQDPLLPLYIVLGILGALVIGVGIAIAVVKLRDRSKNSVAPQNDVPMQAAKVDDPPKKAAEFDANARYTEFEVDPADARYSEL
jgi:hypothetical protein